MYAIRSYYGSLQKEILALIRQQGFLPLSELRRSITAPYGALTRLVELGYLNVDETERRRDPFWALPVTPESPMALTAEQAAALAELEP